MGGKLRVLYTSRKFSPSDSGTGSQAGFSTILSREPVVWDEGFSERLGAFMRRSLQEAPNAALTPSQLVFFCRAAGGTEKDRPESDYFSARLARDRLDNLTYQAIRYWSTRSNLGESAPDVRNTVSTILAGATLSSRSTALSELRAKFWEEPSKLNSNSPVMFQFGRNSADFGYVHFNVAKLYGGESQIAPGAYLRIYVNCDLAGQANLARSLLKAKERDFKFKLANPLDGFRVADLPKEGYPIVIFAGNQAVASSILSMLDSERRLHPEWFSRRKTSAFLSPFGEGIGLAQDPGSSRIRFLELGTFISSQEGEADYTTHRAHMTYALVMKICRGIIADEPDRLFAGRTHAELLLTAKGIIAEQGVPAPSRVFRGTEVPVPSVEEAKEEALLALIAPRIVASLSTQELHISCRKHLPSVLAEFRIDPYNMARNDY